MPAEVELSLELPDVLVEVYRVKQARSRIADAVEAHEAKGHATAAAKGWAFKGRGPRAEGLAVLTREDA